MTNSTTADEFLVARCNRIKAKHQRYRSTGKANISKLKMVQTIHSQNKKRRKTRQTAYQY